MNNLMHLTHTLTLSEKRYFKVSLSNNRTLNYEQLFDYIANKQNDCSNEAIKNHFKGYAFTQNLAVAKADLYKLILVSLRQFYAKTDVDIILSNILSNIKILFNKGLYKECEKEIRNGYKTAMDYDEGHYAYAFKSWEKKMFYISNTKQVMREIDKRYKETALLLKEETLKNEYWKLYRLSFEHFKKVAINADEKSYNALKELVENSIIKNQKPANTFKIQVHHLGILSFYAYLSKNKEACFLYAESIVKLFQKHPKIIQIEPASFLSTLHNVALYAIDIKRYKKAAFWLNYTLNFYNLHKMKNTKHIDNYIFELYNYTHLKLLSKQKKHKEIIALTPMLEAQLKKKKEQITPLKLFEIEFLIAYAFFCNKEYKKANGWISKIVQKSTVNWRKKAVLIELLLFLNTIDSDEQFVDEHIVEFNKRLIAKDAGSKKTRSLLILLSKASLSDKKADYLKVITRLNLLKEENQVEYLLDNLDLEGWLAAKLDKKKRNNYY